jgi:hypothetical protein
MILKSNEQKIELRLLLEKQLQSFDKTREITHGNIKICLINSIKFSKYFPNG